jgi:hypothetical protein
MPYGYLGQNTPNQTVSNSGVFSISDVADLEKQGKFGGSLELIEEQTVSNVASVVFTDLKLSKYDVHYLTYNSLNTNTSTANAIYGLRVSNDGGTSYETTNYQYAIQDGSIAGSFNEVKSTSAGYQFITFTSDTATNNASANGYMYLYNLGNSSKYSFSTVHNFSQINSSSAITYFGGSVYTVAETINALQIITSTSANFDGTFKLYGVKQL